MSSVFCRITRNYFPREELKNASSFSIKIFAINAYSTSKFKGDEQEE